MEKRFVVDGVCPKRTDVIRVRVSTWCEVVVCGGRLMKRATASAMVSTSSIAADLCQS